MRNPAMSFSEAAAPVAHAHAGKCANVAFECPCVFADGLLCELIGNYCDN